MKKLIPIFFLSFLFANEQNEFLNYKQNVFNDFYNYKKELNQEFNEYKEALNKGFKEYKKELSQYWKNPELTSKKVFVEYSKDKKVRKKVDYDKGYIEIDVIGKNKEEAKKKIAKNLYYLLTETTNQAVKQNPVLQKVEKVLKNKKFVKISKPSNEFIVGDMVFKKPTPKKVISYAVEKSKHITIKPSKIKNMKVFTIKVKLPPNSILIKAKRYKKDVLDKANRFDLTPSLIYSIIHTESTYNPLARSYVPAFGLMQIVPQTAGADAYKMLYGQKKVLSPSYLYNSHNNILIGSAYLKKIYYGYMRKIKHPLSRLYCSIAAYNTGAGNVACAFNSNEKDYKGRTVCRRSRGDYNILKASDKINKMTPKEVYNHLLKNLRYDEPKNYLKRVMKRYRMYLEALKYGKL